MAAKLTPNQLKWVEALESGEFIQDTRRRGLLTAVEEDGSKTHCCLGVACVLYARENPDFKVVAVRTHHTGYNPDNEWGSVYYGHLSSYLPQEVRDWLGASRQDPLIGHGAALSASFRNDVLKQTFEEIAAAIREHGVR